MTVLSRPWIWRAICFFLFMFLLAFGINCSGKSICQYHADCRQGSHCSSEKTCVEGCKTNAHCPKGSTCGSGGKCVGAADGSKDAGPGRDLVGTNPPGKGSARVEIFASHKFVYKVPGGKATLTVEATAPDGKKLNSGTVTFHASAGSFDAKAPGVVKKQIEIKAVTTLSWYPQTAPKGENKIHAETKHAKSQPIKIIVVEPPNP